ncbi:uncharacterized protein BXZ73DRAFT_86332 [Epithele typhae]|uniref:uncharacterized protein n=1 Tax=Epithele typhae TaxID=378194 RepID=UPI002008E250|nr:uncharacterized protein BXZ73DRAFT_86332 [Epithele typhae]KAH9946146.1 hypothetical protein BXZ73DRAFT_86332 [Epithele typhae]
MLSRVRRLPTALPRASPRHSSLFTRRHASHGPYPEGVNPYPYLDDSFATNTMHAVGYFGRLFKFTAVGAVLLGTTAFTAFEVAHQYVEHVKLAAEQDPEVKNWQWELEAERWTGSPKGGSDSGLGYRGRHTVRAAWMALYWGAGQKVVASNAFSGGSSGAALAPIDANLEYAQEFLESAIRFAEGAKKIHPMTLATLIARRADIVERIGTVGALDEARAEYTRVWRALGGQGIDAARVALKLGNLNRRLGDQEDALLWWTRTLQLLQATAILSKSPNPLLHPPLLNEPSHQRCWFRPSTRRIRPQPAPLPPRPSIFASASPPQALHFLYLLHRSSMLSVHHAEKPAAAESSERVARSLTLAPEGSRIQKNHSPLLPTEAPLSTMYDNPLRDARSTAAKAWNYLGYLTEKSSAPDASARALECYQRALDWAGVSRDEDGGAGKAGEGVAEADWKVYWADYVRARDVTKGKQQK